MFGSFTAPQRPRARVKQACRLILGASVLASGCDGDGVGNGNRYTRVTSIRIEPNAVSLLVGGQLTLSATAYNAVGRSVIGQPFTWTSSASNIVFVDSGTVIALAVGSATIWATAAGVTGRATVTVTPGTVASVTLEAPRSPLEVGDTMTVSATARNAVGGRIPGKVFGWNSSAPNVAGVAPTGLVTAVGVGSTWIRAGTDGRFGYAEVTVATLKPDTVILTMGVDPVEAIVPVGGTVSLSVSMYNAAGRALVGQPVRWSSANRGIATVSDSGVVSGVAVGGPATISATSQGKTATASIIVVQPGF